MQEWRSCRESGIYELSDDGKIRNRRTGRIMKTSVNSNGREVVQLHYNGQAHTRAIHRLVAEAFYDGDHTGLDVNHKDGNKLNNRVDNLEWMTRQENIQHAFDNGLKNSNHRKRKVRIIETGEDFDSLTECANALGVDKSSVGSCLRGKSKTCRGYHLEAIN